MPKLRVASIPSSIIAVATVIWIFCIGVALRSVSGRLVPPLRHLLLKQHQVVPSRSHVLPRVRRRSLALELSVILQRYVGWVSAVVVKVRISAASAVGAAVSVEARGGGVGSLDRIVAVLVLLLEVAVLIGACSKASVHSLRPVVVHRHIPIVIAITVIVVIGNGLGD